MANSNINILDVEKVEKTISKLESLNESIDGYAKVLRSETNKMSNYWKDNKYKEIKEKFEDDARILNNIKKNSTSIITKMKGQIGEAKQILNVKIQEEK